MRNYIQSSFSQSNSRCTTDTFSQDSECQYTGQGLSFSSGTNIFKYVEFTGCSLSTHGGAIKSTGGTVSIISSSFSSCTANGNNGGAIYAASLSLLSITNTLFNSCGGDHEVKSGGAIALSSVSSINLFDDLFLMCYSGNNAGAIDMRNCGSQQRELPIQCSFFIHCECLKGDGPSAGALEGSGNKCGYFASVLFSSCKSTDAGALWLEPLYYSHSICFSFFTGNSASNKGMDCYLRTNVDSDLFLDCFSTSAPPHLYASDSSWNDLHLSDNWHHSRCEIKNFTPFTTQTYHKQY